MTPGARAAAAIEVLEIFQDTAAPIDRLLKEWSRRSRFAGAKDRANVAGRVYAVLRRRSECAFAMDDDSPRALVLGSLKIIDGLSLDDVAALFSGEGYAPAALTAQERAALCAEDRAPDHDVRLNWPMWLAEKVKPLFEADFDPEIAALNARAPLDLRVNTLARSRQQAYVALKAAGVKAELTAASPMGLRVPAVSDTVRPVNLQRLKPYVEGWVDVQDEGSQIVSLLAAAAPGEQVADLCAGGGGKTLALAAEMKNSGQIYACDINQKRLMAGRPRAQRAGVTNVQYRLLKNWFEGDGRPDPSFEDIGETVDLVFLDAPCSGSGAWRRQPDAKWRLTRQMIDGYKALQRNVLERGARLVRPGGRLVYVTCSLFPEENEDQAFEFLSRHADFEKVELSWDALDGPEKWRHTGIGKQLSPGLTGTDGFYAAMFRRKR
ncbi:MAG: RsmB/NOP family class I SAM-dependent RNA methyltransferase [Pseudomonadota bacterium]